MLDVDLGCGRVQHAGGERSRQVSRQLFFWEQLSDVLRQLRMVVAWMSAMGGDRDKDAQNLAAQSTKRIEGHIDEAGTRHRP